MNQVPQRRPHQDTRERILATGEELISGRGFTALGLSEILSAATVPKGSFYHYFQSKEGFGVAMLERYFADYQQRLTLLFNDENMSALQRIMTYFNNWQAMAETSECHKLCLAVKLAAEVADLSEPMRAALSVGMSGITEQIAQAIRSAQIEGSISNKLNALEIAESLYGMWVGASLITKVNRQLRPLQLAFKQTELLLHPSH
ncbi:TetR/AcrR family transcriptional regulator [Undibacterium sp. SXout11W]|uniref:TetR/AcrR family transcriptional regulator n=1 Tax=Undibacterium sp. SXout11W TaxID=3413050 RepID=UPI003BF30EA1